MVPEFAIVGHPNEGKSSVVSTLTEDDSVRISPVPGETVECQTFSIVVDGRETIRFTDTPGFQNPSQVLRWMQDFAGEDRDLLPAFLAAHAARAEFHDDCELLGPIAAGAGIIYVVDGSRPLRKVDRAEMEILRLTGRPRMAILNSKEEDGGFLNQWKAEFRKHFNAIRVFNSHRATYAERLAMLESLKAIDQDWEPALEAAIRAFVADWRRRGETTATIITTLLADCLGHVASLPLADDQDEDEIRPRLRGKYEKHIADLEREAHERIRGLFRHNVFNYSLPARSLVHEDLFSERTWQLLGLEKKELIMAAAMSGAALGGVVDAMVGGTSLGLFMAIGGASAAGYAALGGAEGLARAKLLGRALGGKRLTMGPCANVQLLYILLDRALLYYSHVINWAHGRRDYPPATAPETGATDKSGFSHAWDAERRKVCVRFFTALRAKDEAVRNVAEGELRTTLMTVLEELAEKEEETISLRG